MNPAIKERAMRLQPTILAGPVRCPYCLLRREAGRRHCGEPGCAAQYAEARRAFELRLSMKGGAR